MPASSNITIKTYNSNAFNLGVMGLKYDGTAPAIYYNTHHLCETLPGFVII